ncbi:hypothetical protein M409DRAFT_31035 [Zasmidium cellare ATCC 36951]|uniref:Peptidase S33 tripeptidyl aminopeptidase-like C-terminal domain-containing protein n=1 Tax=Zasmidium cellare ATCC 36951 TaxID=1080233 RepID=A0A6A6BUI8_ZASCE|nr:uncharacterized protein M409DRAFT_31035 [Zasmidium cellare ATCC 36951]KAF2158457.1 hypothetical protein M409DRAFT_31035 [Zasmidium cellare ATCC 36951]
MPLKLWPCIRLLSIIYGANAGYLLEKQMPLVQEQTKFEWQIIQPSRQLSYHDCYGGFLCTRLDVPLNWNSTGKDREEHRAAVAVIKLPAQVSVTDEEYGGAILMNPGGPGESGVEQLLQRGKAIQTIVDAASDERSEHRKYFDIISFDPRGVKETTPNLHCFPDAFSQQVWLLDRPGYGELYESNTTFNLEWARTEALGKSCTAERGDDVIVPYVNTAQVVEDMTEIIERHGEWRQGEVERLIERQTHESLTFDEATSVRHRTTWHRGGEKLQYWGFSYGTILGQTFAAMHPDRIHRVLIDGVVDPDDYYHGSWLQNLHDSDKAMAKLCEYCFQAGPKGCPLYTGKSAQDIEDKIFELLSELKANPVPVVGPSGSPIAINFDDFYLRIIGSMAFPYAIAENTFQQFAELAKGNVSAVAASRQNALDAAASLAHCHSLSDGCMREESFGLITSTPVIECLDSAPRRHGRFTKDKFRQYFEVLKAQSKWFSASWARHRMSCIGIHSRPAWTYKGRISGITSHPLMIIGNAHDTVTPLRNAQRVSSLFPGSTVLQQNSEGHCSNSNPSSCTAKHIRKYFQTGVLPKPGTICEPDWRPFVGSASKSEKHYSTAEHEMRDAQHQLARPWNMPGIERLH